MRRAKDNDAEAREYIIQRLTPLILSIIKKIFPYYGDREELLQDGYVVLLECIYEFEESAGCPFLVFAKKKLLYYYLNKVRRKNLEVPTDLSSVLRGRDDPGYDGFSRLLKVELYKALGGISEKQKRVVMMHYFENKSLKEISEILNLHYQSVVKLKERALANLKKRLTEHMFD